jgi:hypothetical protein
MVSRGQLKCANSVIIFLLRTSHRTLYQRVMRSEVSPCYEHRQYALDPAPIFQEGMRLPPPCVATTSGGTPCMRSSEALPIRKPCPFIDERSPAPPHISVTLSMNHRLVMGAQSPAAVSKVKRGAASGTEALAERWCRKAMTGLSGQKPRSIMSTSLSWPKVCGSSNIWPRCAPAQRTSWFPVLCAW